MIKSPSLKSPSLKSQLQKKLHENTSRNMAQNDSNDGKRVQQDSQAPSSLHVADMPTPPSQLGRPITSFNNMSNPTPNSTDESSSAGNPAATDRTFAQTIRKTNDGNEVSDSLIRGRFPQSRGRQGNATYKPSKADYEFRGAPPPLVDYNPDLPDDLGVRWGNANHHPLRADFTSRRRQVPRQSRKGDTDENMNKEDPGDANSILRHAPIQGTLPRGNRSPAEQSTPVAFEAMEIDRLGAVLFEAALAAGDASSSSSSYGDEDNVREDPNAFTPEEQAKSATEWAFKKQEHSSNTHPNAASTSVSQAGRSPNPYPIVHPNPSSSPVKGEAKMDWRLRG